MLRVGCWLLAVGCVTWGLDGASRADDVDRPLVFAVMGDVPYGEHEFPILRQQLKEIDRGLPFVVHVGDIKRGAEPCNELVYQRVSAELKQSPIPVLIIPGDNEYNDCEAPDQAWDYWVQYFDKFEEHWEHGLPIKRSSKRNEQFALVQDDVLFVGIHLVGGRVHDKQEWTERMADCAAWIETNFNQHGNAVRAAVVFAHAHGIKTRQAFGDTFARLASEFGKPVLYIHGDGHHWIHDRPWESAPNVLRVQIDQGGLAPPLRVTVAPSPVDGETFLFERNLTDEYIQRRQEYAEQRAAAKQTPSTATP